MVSVVFHDTSSTARAFLRDNGDLWPAVSDPGGTIAEHYGVTAPPTTFVVGPTGRVAAVLVGPATQKNLDSFLKAARAQQARRLQWVSARARLPLWARVAVPLAVLAVALVIGSGAFDSSPPTVAQRAAAIEANVRCPSCTDLSVARVQRDDGHRRAAPDRGMVAAGSSTADIDRALVAEYGQTILLVPPDTGGVPLIWVVPIVLGAAALIGVGVVFWRRSRDFEALRAKEPVS